MNSETYENGQEQYEAERNFFINEAKAQLRNLTRQWNQQEEHGQIAKARETMAKIEKLEKQIKETE